ncbi:MAG: hypothetical protein MJ174_10970 [Treponema sp.]|nr:hypothetical protein [Treponema sp.]
MNEGYPYGILLLLLVLQGTLFQKFFLHQQVFLVPEYNLEQLMTLIAEKEYGIA